MSEFTKKLIKLEASLKLNELNAALNVLDHNNDGLIEFSEFMALFDLGDDELDKNGNLD
jgi:Ca2+-binding EF-hand superfamily protein